MAANRIKGITIEIGGDTTKLDKALAGTNKSLKDTQSQLKDVERLLKIDPGNTDLLEQKQRLLAQTMKGTAEQLKIVKDAASDADAQLARYQDFQSKYAPLLKAHAEARASYETLKAKDEDLKRQLELGEISSEQYDKHKAKVDDAKKSYSDLGKQVAAAKKEMGGPMMDQAQYDAVHRALVSWTEDARKAEKAFNDFNVAAAEISATADKVSDGAAKVADATKGISAAAGAAATGLLGLAVNAGKTADDLNTLSKQSGFSTETLQQWTYASDLIDVAMEDIVAAARKMKKNMVSESADVQEAWNTLGVSVVDGSGHLRDAESVFNDLVRSLSNVQNETERDALAMTLFGKSADDLAGIIDDGGQALRQLGQEAKDAGLILSQDALDSANKFNDGLDTLKAKAEATFLESGANLAEKLLPALEQIVEAVGSLLNWFASLDGETLSLLLKVLLAVAAIAPIASAISAIAGAVSAVSAGVGALTGALGAFNIVGAMTSMTLGQWVLIIGAVVVAVLLLVAAFNALTGKASKIEMPEMPEIPTVSGSTPRSSGTPYSMRTVSSQDLPHLAQGTVTRPNSPFLAVVGDNETEPEIVAPYSTIKRAAMDAMSSAGARNGATAVYINFTGDLAQLARILQPQITTETQRLGPELVN